MHLYFLDTPRALYHQWTNVSKDLEATSKFQAPRKCHAVSSTPPKVQSPWRPDAQDICIPTLRLATRVICFASGRHTISYQTAGKALIWLWGDKLQSVSAALWIGHGNSVERHVTPTATVPRRAWNSTNNTYNYVIFRCGGNSPRGLSLSPNITVKAGALQTRISSPMQVTALSVSVSPITTQTVQGTSRKQRQGNRQTVGWQINSKDEVGGVKRDRCQHSQEWKTLDQTGIQMHLSLSCYRQIFLLARYIPLITAHHENYRTAHGMSTAWARHGHRRQLI